MPRNFRFVPRNVKLPALGSVASAVKEPKVVVRTAIGLLLAANLVMAAFAFHLIGTSNVELTQQLESARLRMQADQARLTRSRLVSNKVETGRAEGDKFLASYMTSRRNTYSTIISEITETAKTAGMKMKEGSIAPLDPIEGSNDLDMMSISMNFEGSYAQLVKFMNLLDRSARFMIIESMTAAPQAKGDVLNVNVKLNTFVKDDTGGIS